uniref:Uncharacterized protein n=1 Tax=Romanomermis culicivorax TaxID=13658 RepID=A0A915HQV4_ROMCU
MSASPPYASYTFSVVSSDVTEMENTAGLRQNKFDFSDFLIHYSCKIEHKVDSTYPRESRTSQKLDLKCFNDNV